MRSNLILGILFFFICSGYTQRIDTLRHLSSDDSLTAYKYEGSNQWGYITGHNHLGRQEYAEKYFIEGTAKVTGLISYHTGVVRNKKNVGAFIIYSVNEEGLPGNILNRKFWYFGDIDLSGEAYFTSLTSPVEVVDSFFVSFDLTDYSHGGFDGDTIAVLTGLDGSRADTDLAIWARNVTRFHNHSTPDFRDLYYQNGTPIATHLAMYPILEFDVISSTDKLNKSYVGKGHLQLYPPYPNPVEDIFTLKFSQEKASNVGMELYDISGERLIIKDFGRKMAGTHTENIHIGHLSSGIYIYIVQTEDIKLAGRLVVK